MWEPGPLTALRAFTACYRDSFNFYFYNTEFLNLHYQDLICEKDVLSAYIITTEENSLLTSV
jgi:hypothetical protein